MPYLDTAIFEFLNRGVANPAFDAVFPILTSLHQQKWFMASLAVLALTALWRGGRRTRLFVVAAVAAVGVSDVACSKVIKKAIERERPCQAVARGDVAALSFPVRVVNPDRCPGSRSLPSNHAANMAAVGTVCWWFTRGRKRWLWVLLPLVIGYTRIYLGYHYPSDVLTGWMIGIAIASIVIQWPRRLLRELAS